MDNKKYVGGSKLFDQEIKKYKIKIREGSIKREHLDPAFVSIWDDVQKNAMNVNTLQELLNQYYSTMQNAISFSCDTEVIAAGETKDVTFTFDCINASDNATVDVYRDGTQIIHSIPSAFPYVFTISDATTGLYRCEANVDGIKYVGLWEIKESYDFWIGTGTDYNAVLVNPSYKHVGASSLSGTYFLNPSAGDYIYIICRSNVVPASVIIGSFPVPGFDTHDAVDIITIDGAEYTVYQSANTYQATSIELVVNDIQYDTDSYIAHLIEEIVSLKNVAEKIETIADEETITINENSKVALKNRPMVKNLNGDVVQKGYVILKENDSFKSVVEGYTEGNVIFEIDYAYDLGEESVEIPEGCTLKFEGGSLRNGELVGDGTEIDYHSPIFDDITVSGSWNVPTINSWIFKDLSKEDVLRQVFNLCSDDVSNVVNIVHTDAPYIYAPKNNNSDKGVNEGNMIPSNTIVNNGGVIKVKPNPYIGYNVFNVNGKENVQIRGGEIIGDRDEHDYSTYTPISTHEWGHGIRVVDSKNVIVENVHIHDCTGDGMSITGNDVLVNNVKIHNCRRQGITIAKCSNLKVSNFAIYDIQGTAPQSAIDFEPNSGAYENVILENGNVYQTEVTVGMQSGIQIIKAMSYTINGSGIVLSNIRFDKVRKPITISSADNIKLSNIIITDATAGSTTGYPITLNRANKISFDNISVSVDNTLGSLTYIDKSTDISINNSDLSAKRITCIDSEVTITNSKLGGIASIAQSITIDNAGYTLFGCVVTGLCEPPNKRFDAYNCKFSATDTRILYGERTGTASFYNCDFVHNDKDFADSIISTHALTCLFQGCTFTALNRKPIIEDYASKNNVYLDCKVLSANDFIKTNSNTDVISVGPTSLRPVDTTYVKPGFRFFDTSLGVELTLTEKRGEAVFTQTVTSVDAGTYLFFANTLQANKHYYATFNNYTCRVYFAKADNVDADVSEITNNVKGVSFYSPDAEEYPYIRIYATFTGSITQTVATIYEYDLVWVNADGVNMTGVTSVRGTTATRESMDDNLTSANAGLKYYDTSLSKYVLWNGSTWTNLDGTALS